MSLPASRVPSRQAPRPEPEPFLPLLLREVAEAAGRDVALRLDPHLEHVPAGAGLDLAEVVWLLLEHADSHDSDLGVLVRVEVRRTELRLTVSDDSCTTACAAHSSQLDRVWSLGAPLGERRCQLRSGLDGGVRLEWTAPVDVPPRARAGRESRALPGA